MRKIISSISLVLFCGAFMLGGCAKEKMVKPDEPVAVQTPVAKQPDQMKQPVKEEKIETPAIKESSIARDEAAASAATQADEKAAKLLHVVYFDFDSSTLSQAARDALSQNANILLKKHASLKVLIEGHCDERGSAEYNLALGERRAKSALAYLLTLGVPGKRLSVISYGKEKPSDTGHDEAAWAKNRRAEFVATR